MLTVFRSLGVFYLRLELGRLVACLLVGRFDLLDTGFQGRPFVPHVLGHLAAAEGRAVAVVVVVVLKVGADEEISGKRWECLGLTRRQAFFSWCR